jgi:proteasome lid subunit RPN8/RPN11
VKKERGFLRGRDKGRTSERAVGEMHSSPVEDCWESDLEGQVNNWARKLAA